MLDFITYPIGSLIHYIYEIVITLSIEFISPYALTIILATILLKLAMYPINLKQFQSSEKMNEIQPKIKVLQEKYNDAPELLNTKMMALYKENNFNPLTGFLPILIQMPIIIAFYNVMRDPLLYIFKDPNVYTKIDKSFLWIKDLSLTANHISEAGSVNGFDFGISLPVVGSAIPVLAIVAAITTYLSSKVSSQKNDSVNATMNTVLMIMPIMILVFALNMPSGLVLYWIIGNVFQIIQQYLFKIDIRSLFINLSRRRKYESQNSYR